MPRADFWHWGPRQGQGLGLVGAGLSFYPMPALGPQLGTAGRHCAVWIVSHTPDTACPQAGGSALDWQSWTWQIFPVKGLRVNVVGSAYAFLISFYNL